MMDSAIDVIPSVLHYLGRSPDSVGAGGPGGGVEGADGDTARISASSPAAARWRLWRPARRAWQWIIPATWPGRGRGQRPGCTVRYVAPKEGAEIGFDMLAIPSDAPHKDEALAFINFVLRPDIMARITDATRYPNAVPATRVLVRPDAAGGPERVSVRCGCSGSSPSGRRPRPPIGPHAAVGAVQGGRLM